MAARGEGSVEGAKPDFLAVYGLLRAINRGDGAGAYALATRWQPEELVVALVEAHLGAVRTHAARELDAAPFSSVVTERVDQLLKDALQECRIARVLFMRGARGG